MQRLKIFSKYFLSDEYLKYPLKFKFNLAKNHIENIDKIKNKAFIEFLKNYPLDKQKSNKLINLFINFPIDKFLIFNNIIFKFLQKINLNLNFLKRKSKEHDIINEKFVNTSRNENKFLRLYKHTNINSNNNENKSIEKLNISKNGNNILYDFELDFINKAIKEKNNNFCIDKKIRNKISLDKKISIYQNYNSKNNEHKHTETYESIKSLEEHKSDQNNLLYYTKLIDEINKNCKLQRKSNISDINLKSEIEFIRNKIRNKKIIKIKKFFKKILKLLNIKHLLDLKNTKNIIQSTFSFLSKNITLYKHSMNELVEGQREVTHNKNFKFEDGQSVKEKMEIFEKKLKENMNLNDHYENLKKK